MISLIVGLTVQLGVLLSIIYMFNSIEQDEKVERCMWTGRGAARGVIVFGQGLGSLGGRARGHLEYQPSVVQLEEVYPVLAGITDHLIFRDTRHLDNILRRVDAVVYAGPAGVLDEFEKTKEFLSFTYPSTWLSSGPFVRNDEFVFKAVRDVLDRAQRNVTLSEILAKKVLFVLYLTSVPVLNLKCPNNSTQMYENQLLLLNGMSGLQADIEQYYNDEKTVFVSIPQWSIFKDENPKLGVWGRGASRLFASGIQLTDVCPLLASLLGIPVPTESVGRLPLSYLNVSLEEEAKALACNAIQLEQLVSFSGTSYQNQTKLVTDYIKQKKYNDSKILSEQLIRNSYTTLKCFDKTVYCLVVFSLIGLMFVLITEPMTGFTSPNLRLLIKPISVIISLFLVIVSFEFVYITFVRAHSYLHIIYMNLSLIPWFLLLTRYKIIWHWCLGHAKIDTLLYICSMIFLEEILLYFLNGGFATVFLLSCISALPLLPRFRKTPFVYSAGWYTCCCFIIGLLNFPRELIKSRTKLINMASTFWLCYSQSTVFYFNPRCDAVISQILVIYMSMSTILANAFILISSIPPLFYYFSWSTFTALMLPITGTKKVQYRLIHVSLSYGPSLLLLSRDIEAFSYAILMLFVICWSYLERSNSDDRDKPWCGIRRGTLLALSCSLGYLLTGRLAELTPDSVLIPFLPLHIYWNDPIPYYGMLIYKYMAMFTVVMTVYNSFLADKWKTDQGFVYGLILIEMICLRYLVQILFPTSNHSEAICNHIFINMFAILYMVSYWLGMIFSTKYVKEEIKDLNETVLQNST